jgi:hypothetical protein
MHANPILVQDLERRALHGLICEWKEAVSFLHPAARVTLRLPIFALRDFERGWGQWRRERREIAISRRLVMDYPWVCARDVLLHEIAHQVTDELLGGDDTPHGPVFREACETLHADPRPTADYVPLCDPMRADASPSEDRVMSRVKKLLALAQSSNAHEAEAAMAKAHDQIVRYNLDGLMANTARTYCSVMVGEPALRHAEHDYALAHLLQDFYFVEMIWISAFSMSKGKMGRVLELSGTPENVEMAGYVHDFLRRVIADRWEDYCRGHRLPHSQSQDFASGLVKGFREKLESQRRGWEQGGAETRALVRVQDPQLRAYFRRRYPRIRHTRGWGRQMDMAAHRAGHKAGRSVILSQPLRAAAANRRLLLG